MRRMDTSYSTGNFEKIPGKKVQKEAVKTRGRGSEWLWNLHTCISSKLSWGNLIHIASSLSWQVRLNESHRSLPTEIMLRNYSRTGKQTLEFLKELTLLGPVSQNYHNVYVLTQETKCRQLKMLDLWKDPASASEARSSFWKLELDMQSRYTMHIFNSTDV